jgi:gluconate kinase
VFILASFFGFEVIMKSQEEGHQFVFLGSGERLVLTLWKQREGHFGLYV